MNFKKIFSLKERRRELELRIAQKRRAIIEGERALNLLDKLEGGALDERIERIRANITLDSIPYVRSADHAREEDRFTGRKDCRRERDTIDALLRLKKDLPAIKQHWRAKLNEALANN